MFVHSLAGELAEGTVLAEEVEGVNEATGSTLAAYGAVALAAWRGDESKTTELINETIEDVKRRGEGMGLGISYFLSALLYNGLGRYADALAAAETACEYPDLGVFAVGPDRTHRGGDSAPAIPNRPLLPSRGFRKRPATQALTGRLESRFDRKHC